MKKNKIVSKIKCDLTSYTLPDDQLIWRKKIVSCEEEAICNEINEIFHMKKAVIMI